MHSAVACCGRGAERPSSVLDFSFFVSLCLEIVAEAWLNECPASCVLRLLLRPALSGVRELCRLALNRPEGERCNLLDTDNGDIVNACLCASTVEIVIHLARAVDHFAHFLRLHKVRVIVRQDPIEAEALSECFDVAACAAELEKLLGSDHHQRLPESSTHLSTEKMEVLRRGSDIGDSHVSCLHDLPVGFVFCWEHVRCIRELEEALHAG